MVKMIALDLDGTLTWTDHMTVTQGNREALKMAHDKGANLAIATGRTLAIIGNICEQVPEIDYIMYSNGAGVYDRKKQKTIYKNFMSWELCEDILEYLLSLPSFLEVYVNGKDYIQNDRIKYMSAGVLPQEFIDKLLEQMTPVDSLMDIARGNEIEKITIYLDENYYASCWDKLSKYDELYLTSSLPISMEITMFDANKGTALDGMCKVLGITSDECMAFGDAGNDCEMLEYSNYSFAMKNATEECKKAAKYETLSNANDGVAYGIHKIFGE